MESETAHFLDINGTMGVGENIAVANVSIYPNPANDFIMIESENETEIKIYSVSGQMVLRQSISEGTNTIDVSKLNSGIYFIDLEGVMNKVVVKIRFKRNSEPQNFFWGSF